MGPRRLGRPILGVTRPLAYRTESQNAQPIQWIAPYRRVDGSYAVGLIVVVHRVAPGAEGEAGRPGGVNGVYWPAPRLGFMAWSRLSPKSTSLPWTAMPRACIIGGGVMALAILVEATSMVVSRVGECMVADS